ncbi:MAG: DUF2251 domain-containing protein [Pseudomonadota bacterium]
MNISPDLDLYESSVSEDGKRGAVFEVVDGTSYFYPCHILGDELRLLRPLLVKAHLDEATTVAIDWRRDEWLVVLLVDNEAVAAYDFALGRSYSHAVDTDLENRPADEIPGARKH